MSNELKHISNVVEITTNKKTYSADLSFDVPKEASKEAIDNIKRMGYNMFLSHIKSWEGGEDA